MKKLIALVIASAFSIGAFAQQATTPAAAPMTPAMAKKDDMKKEMPAKKAAMKKHAAKKHAKSMKSAA